MKWPLFCYEEKTLTKTKGLYWFTNDLRIHDNALLELALEHVDELVCCYVYPELTRFLGHFSQESHLGAAKQRFIRQSVEELASRLGEKGITLLPFKGSLKASISTAIEQNEPTHLFCSHSAGHDEKAIIGAIKLQFKDLKVVQLSNSSLFQEEDLPFDLDDLPKTFTQFRKKIESAITPLFLPSAQFATSDNKTAIGAFNDSVEDYFRGGESEGLAHCERYFSSELPSTYKLTRNGLDGLTYSTKFSPWLAFGCVSPLRIYTSLKQYEAQNGQNDSTYWIYFELLWREYFYWYGRKHQRRLFVFSGLHDSKPLTTFYPQRFKQWKEGRTAFPIVNACMNQLRETGYISNRGRQLVASCLIHELGIDWRYGAAYFETQLLDYDVGSNWGNWQYLAGVGADANGSRQFNLTKQTEIYDPHGEFIEQWNGEACCESLDTVDMVDWPIFTNRLGK